MAGTGHGFGRRPARALRGADLACCVLVVVCAHLFVVIAPARPAATPAAIGSRPALQVRVVPEAQKRASVPAETVPAEGRRQDVARTGEPLRDRAVASAATRKVESQQRLAPAAPSTGEAVVVDYLPRSALTVGPRPNEPVLIDYPYFDGEADKYLGEFDVFIDETGSVVRVTTETPDLPGILANAVREAFHSARFSPGELHGQPVRSRIRIEVTFDKSGLQPS